MQVGEFDRLSGRKGHRQTQGRHCRYTNTHSMMIPHFLISVCCQTFLPMQRQQTQSKGESLSCSGSGSVGGVRPGVYSLLIKDAQVYHGFLHVYIVFSHNAHLFKMHVLLNPISADHSSSIRAITNLACFGEVLMLLRKMS